MNSNSDVQRIEILLERLWAIVRDGKIEKKNKPLYYTMHIVIKITIYLIDWRDWAWDPNAIPFAFDVHIRIAMQ